MMTNHWLRIGLFLLLWSAASLTQAVMPGERAATAPESAGEQANKGLVGIIAGGVNGTYIRIAADMSTVLDTDGLRILTIVGKGSVQNISDLLYLKGVDMAIVQSDVLEYIKRQGTYRAIDKRIDYITKLYNEEFHLLASSGIRELHDLTGRKVNFDVKGSGTSITASILFDILKIPVEPTYYDQAAALEKLKSGEISALAYVAGKPAPLFEPLTYLPTYLKSQDYPKLIEPDQNLKTVAVGAVLAVYHWERSNPRYQRIANFVHHFF